MPKKAPELAAVAVKRLTQPGLYAVGGVAGLHLQVRGVDARSWILRATVGGKRRDIGLGGFPDVPLADAREKARQARALIEQGIDPVGARKDARSTLEAQRRKETTFKQAAEEFLASRGGEWKNPKHAKQWSATLEAYAYPVIGALQVKDVELAHITKILEPIWTDKTETAKRLRGRIENVLDHATVKGYRKGDNPARWKGFLDKILPAPSKVAKSKNFKAIPVAQVGGFMQRLKEREGMGARALEFAILTAARSGEVRGATWNEIDLQNTTWTIPAERMKAGKEHRVPLSPQAVKLLEALPRFKDVAYVFPAERGGMLSDMAMNVLMRKMKADGVPHGFRSTFRDWCAENTNYPREVAEQALAHAIESKVEAAYRRGDLFEKRKKLMNEWARFCNTVQSESGKVVKIRGKR